MSRPVEMRNGDRTDITRELWVVSGPLSIGNHHKSTHVSDVVKRESVARSRACAGDTIRKFELVEVFSEVIE